MHFLVFSLLFCDHGCSTSASVMGIKSLSKHAAKKLVFEVVCSPHFLNRCFMHLAVQSKFILFLILSFDKLKYQHLLAYSF